LGQIQVSDNGCFVRTPDVVEENKFDAQGRNPPLEIAQIVAVELR
jgi:hypothetical protein